MASLGLTLQREGVIGVTEEVRTLSLDPDPCPPRPRPHTQTLLLGVIELQSPTQPAPWQVQDLSNTQKPPMFVLGLV